MLRKLTEFAECTGTSKAYRDTYLGTPKSGYTGIPVILRTPKRYAGLYKRVLTGPRSAVGNVSGYRCVSDCRVRGREFDPGPVPYFRGD